MHSGLVASTFPCGALLPASYIGFKKYCQHQNMSEMNSTVFFLERGKKKKTSFLTLPSVLGIPPMLLKFKNMRVKWTRKCV